MGTVNAGFSMSLDGYIAGPGDDVSEVFRWMSLGDTSVKVAIGDQELELKVAEEDVGRWDEQGHGFGAIICGRRTFDVAGAFGGKHPMNVPVVVLTHSVPAEWADKPGTPFAFVTQGGVEAAVAKAQQIAGDKSVGVGGADVARQCLKAGLLDEIGIDLAPVLLGGGVRLFEYLGIEPIELECTSVSEAPGVTHLRYRVKK